MGRMHCPDSASTDKKITEAYFQKVLISSVLGILLCMVGLVSTTWALFSTEIVSENNAITMGGFTASTTVVPDTPVTYSDNVQTFPLAGPGSYTFTITPAEGSTRGYCDISAVYEDGTSIPMLVTETLSLEEGAVNSVSFVVTLEDSTALGITIASFWGESGAEPLVEVPTYTFRSESANSPEDDEGTTPDDGDPGDDEGQTDVPEQENTQDPDNTIPPADPPAAESGSTETPDTGEDTGIENGTGEPTETPDESVTQ